MLDRVRNEDVRQALRQEAILDVVIFLYILLMYTY